MPIYIHKKKTMSILSKPIGRERMGSNKSFYCAATFSSLNKIIYIICVFPLYNRRIYYMWTAGEIISINSTKRFIENNIMYLTIQKFGKKEFSTKLKLRIMIISIPSCTRDLNNIVIFIVINYYTFWLYNTKWTYWKLKNFHCPNFRHALREIGKYML